MDRQDLLKVIEEIHPNDRGLYFGRSVLSDTAVMRHMNMGNIIIDPFISRNLSTSSYDVTLGDFFYREQKDRGPSGIYNPWSEDDVKRVWGREPKRAELAGEWMDRHNVTLENIHKHDKIIWIWPGETILCHTQEFIGGTGGIITTMMKARSTLGRSFIEICKCAGWGDVGYINRWTMEVTNNSRWYKIPLVVGRRTGQIIFFEVEKIRSIGSQYGTIGKYQSSSDIDEVKASWTPESMLPKMYLDREIEETRLRTP